MLFAKIYTYKISVHIYIYIHTYNENCKETKLISNSVINAFKKRYKTRCRASTFITIHKRKGIYVHILYIYAVYNINVVCIHNCVHCSTIEKVLLPRIKHRYIKTKSNFTLNILGT